MYEYIFLVIINCLLLKVTRNLTFIFNGKKGVAWVNVLCNCDSRKICFGTVNIKYTLSFCIHRKTVRKSTHLTKSLIEKHVNESNSIEKLRHLFGCSLYVLEVLILGGMWFSIVCGKRSKQNFMVYQINLLNIQIDFCWRKAGPISERWVLNPRIQIGQYVIKRSKSFVDKSNISSSWDRLQCFRACTFVLQNDVHQVKF